MERASDILTNSSAEIRVNCREASCAQKMRLNKPFPVDCCSIIIHKYPICRAADVMSNKVLHSRGGTVCA